MKSPDRYTTETHKRPHSQLAMYLARPPLHPKDAHRKHKANTIVKK